MNINNIIDNAYELYMPQERDEITSLAKFVYNLQPNIIVEIGSKFGGTFMIWNEVTNAITISIDLVEGIHGGITRNDFASRNQYFKNRYGDRCTFIEGDSHDASTFNSLLSVLNVRKIDF
jgi:cephalosporin hydroxylase